MRSFWSGGMALSQTGLGRFEALTLGPRPIAALSTREADYLTITARLDSTRVLPPHLRAGIRRGAEHA
jgi:hypothetical protein